MAERPGMADLVDPTLYGQGARRALTESLVPLPRGRPQTMEEWAAAHPGDRFDPVEAIIGLVGGPRLGRIPGGIRPPTRLPMDEPSRMARAAEQGYTIDAYKGMYPYDWNTVPVRNARGQVIEGADRVPVELTSINANAFLPEAGRGAGFFSSDPRVASRFAQAIGEGTVFPTKLKMENPKIIDAKGKFAAEFQFGPGGNRLRLAEDSPHDGIILKNTKDEGDVYIPRTPDQIRSRFANFDPINKGSGMLLGSVAGMGAIAAQDQYANQ